MEHHGNPANAILLPRNLRRQFLMVAMQLPMLPNIFLRNIVRSVAKISFETSPSFMISIKKTQHFFVQSQKRSNHCKPALAALPEPPGEEPWSRRHRQNHPNHMQTDKWRGQDYFTHHRLILDSRWKSKHPKRIFDGLYWSVDSELTARGFCQLEFKFHNFKKDSRPPDTIPRVCNVCIHIAHISHSHTYIYDNDSFIFLRVVFFRELILSQLTTLEFWSF